jgi:hypothetical protein
MYCYQKGIVNNLPKFLDENKLRAKDVPQW